MAGFKDKSLLYYSLAALLDAGLPIETALARCSAGKFRSTLKKIISDLDAGMKLHEAMLHSGMFSAMESSLIAVGERTGSLPILLRSLSEWFKDRHDFRSKFISAFAYPLFLYHFTGLAISVVKAFSSGGTIESSAVFFICWIIAPWAGLIFIKLLLHCIVTTKWLTAITDCIPFAGSLLFNMESAFFFKVLGIALGAGGGASSSIILAADCCQTTFYSEHYKKTAKEVSATSCSITDAMAMHMTSREYNSPIPGLMAAAETSGTLPECCERISRMQMENASVQLKRTAAVVPAAFYLGICVYAAYRIISFYSGYLSQINSLLDI